MKSALNNFITSFLSLQNIEVKQLEVFQRWLLLIMTIQFGAGFSLWSKISNNSSLINKEAIQSFISYNDTNFFLTFHDTFDYIYVAIFILSFSLFIFRRFSKGIILLFIGNLILLQINYLYDSGDKIILNYWLFFLSLSHLSNKKRWKKVHLRLIQLQLGAMYLFSALTKVADPIWWKGEGIIHLIEREKILHPYLDIFSSFESLLYLVNYIIIFFELSFVFLCNKPFFKKPVFQFGICFHLGVVIFLGHWELSLMFLVAYVTFFPGIGLPMTYFSRLAQSTMSQTNRR